MADAFLDHAPRMVDFLEAHSEVRFRAYAHHPDYAPGVGGSTTSGRVLEPVPFDARVLGRDFATLSAPLPEFTVFGGMMVDRTDIGHLLGATRSLGSFSHAARIVLRHGADRLRHHRGTRLVMGNALAGRLFYSLKRRGVPVLTATQVIELIEDNGRITGARLQSGSGTAIVRCRRGVVLATGGLSRNPELRRRLLPGLRRAFSGGRGRDRRRLCSGSEGRRAPRRQSRQQRVLDAGLGAQAARRQHGRLPASRARPGQARRHRRRCHGEALRQRGHQLSCLRRGHAGGRCQPLPPDLRRRLHRQVRPRHGAAAPDEPAQGRRRRLRDAGINAGGTRRGAAHRRKGPR